MRLAGANLPSIYGPTADEPLSVGASRMVGPDCPSAADPDVPACPAARRDNDARHAPTATGQTVANPRQQAVVHRKLSRGVNTLGSIAATHL